MENALAYSGKAFYDQNGKIKSLYVNRRSSRRLPETWLKTSQVRMAELKPPVRISARRGR